MSDLRYPIGPWTLPASLGGAELEAALADIAALPARLAEAVAGLDERRLDTPYRDGGWTVRQLVHHVADSHLNAYCRHRLTLTEAQPTIRPYDEAAWAELEDARRLPVGVSLALLACLHERWTALLGALPPASFDRQFHHPDWPQPWTLGASVLHYSWHGRHHTAHVTALRRRAGW